MKKPSSHPDILPRPTAARRLADGALLLALLCALALFCLNTYLGPFYYDQSPVVSFRPAGAMDCVPLLPALGVCIGAGLVSLLVWSLPRLRWLAALALLLSAGTVIWLNWRALACGALLLWERLSLLFTHATGFPGYFEPTQALSAILTPNQLYRLTDAQRQAAMQALLAAAAALYALPLGWAVARVRSFWLTFSLTLPWLFPAILAEVALDWPALMAVCACWAALLLSSLAARGNANAAARVTLTSLPAALAVILAISLAFPGEGYVQPAWAVNAREELLALEWFSGGDTPGGSGSDFSGAGGSLTPSDSVDLSAAGPRRYTGQAVMEVTGSRPGTVYLRGMSYQQYGGASWTGSEMDAADRFQGYQLQLPSTVSQLDSLAVIYLGTSGTLAYHPYGTMLIDGLPAPNLLYTETALVFSSARSWYPVDYRALEGDPAPRELSDAGLPDGSTYAELYQDYVSDNYLDVPSQLTIPLSQWYRQAVAELEGSGEAPAGGHTGPYAQALDAAALIAQLLERTAEYDLNAPAAPEGEDFVLYFLEESQQGYCVHFATAATLLLRLQGVPARYVTGYTADIPEEGGTDTVRDWDAHAWVEIFLEDYGWYPVEVTPAARQEDDPERTPAPTPQPSRAPQASQSPQTTPRPEADPDPEEDGGAAPAWLPLLLLLTPVCTAPIWLPRLLALLVRAWWSARRKRGGNAAALALYRRFELLSRRGGAIPPRAKELAEKARFSQHTLTWDEVEELLNLLARATAQLGRALPLPQRGWMKLFLTALGCPPPDIPI